MKWLRSKWRATTSWVKRVFTKPAPKAPVRPITVGTVCPPDIAADYKKLLSTVQAETMPNWLEEAVYKNVHKFKTVEDVTMVPWQIVAFITLREASIRWEKGKKPDFKWERCLHNGDRWDRRTTHVPKGLGPWRSWESAAADAMNRRRRPSSWDNVNTLWFLEQYNGLGYRKSHPHVKSPYIWGKSNHYTRGGYHADGKWSERYVNKQIGAVPFLLHFGFLDAKLDA